MSSHDYARRTRTLAFALAASLSVVPARAEVTRVEISSRSDLRSFGYEKIVGRVHFAVDPKDPRNTVVVDLDKAPRSADGRVEFSADLWVLKPKMGGNGVALVDVVNCGWRTVFGFNRGAPADPSEAELGDGFVLKRGFTIVCVGWEFDLPARADAIRIDVPIAAENGKPITGLVRAAFTPDRPRRVVASRGTVPRDRWKLSGNVVTLTGGFEPGRNYELVYRAANPPIGGLGFAAVRDVATWMKHAADAVAPAKYAYAFGQSQSGRFLRDFLYQGFNTIPASNTGAAVEAPR